MHWYLNTHDEILPYPGLPHTTEDSRQPLRLLRRHHCQQTSKRLLESPVQGGDTAVLFNSKQSLQTMVRQHGTQGQRHELHHLQ